MMTSESPVEEPPSPPSPRHLDDDENDDDEWFRLDPDEIAAHFDHYVPHMELDFAYNNDMTFSEHYLRTLSWAWSAVALARRDGYGAGDGGGGGFVDFDGYVRLATIMHANGRIDSWRFDDAAEREIRRELGDGGGGFMSLRRFCLYAERDVVLDERENLASSRIDEGASTAFRGSYENYRRNCRGQTALDLRRRRSNNDFDAAMKRAERYVRVFESRDLERTGWSDRDALWEALRELASTNDDNDDDDERHFFATSRQSALRSLRRAFVLRRRRRRVDEDEDEYDDSSLERMLEANRCELEARLRFDAEFDIAFKEKDDEFGATTARSNHRVDLRQYCAFVERPDEDYYGFPNHTAFRRQLRRAEWSPTLYSLIGRYCRNTPFQRQVWTFLLVERRLRGNNNRSPLSDGVLSTVLSFLPRDLTSSS